MFRKLFFLAFGLCVVGAIFSASAHSLPKEVPSEPNTPKISLQHKHTKNCDETPAEPVQIICILDRSGSMSGLAGDTIGGYNSFLDKQKQNSGKAEVTTILFDDQYEIISESVDINEAKHLTSEEYFARGTTALLDALGRTVSNTLGKMETEKICPAKRRVLFLIMTDGLENASREYNKSAVKSLIEATTKEYNWNYIFIGANIDSVSEATSLGINAKNAADYSHDSDGVQKSFSMMDSAATEVRETGNLDENWKKH